MSDAERPRGDREREESRSSGSGNVNGESRPPVPIHYLKGCDESVWREPTGNRNVAPDQVLKPEGWEDVGPMDPKAWLTNSSRATAEQARQVAAELGLPTDVFG